MRRDQLVASGHFVSAVPAMQCAAAQVLCFGGNFSSVWTRVPVVQLSYIKGMQSIETHQPIAEKESFRCLNCTHCSGEF